MLVRITSVPPTSHTWYTTSIFVLNPEIIDPHAMIWYARGVVPRLYILAETCSKASLKIQREYNTYNERMNFIHSNMYNRNNEWFRVFLKEAEDHCLKTVASSCRFTCSCMQTYVEVEYRYRFTELADTTSESCECKQINTSSLSDACLIYTV